MNQLFEGAGDLCVRAAFQRIAEILAVDLAVTEEGAEASVEHTCGGGEGEGPDLGLVPELPDARGVLRTLAPGVPEAYDLGQCGGGVQTRPYSTVRTVSPTAGVWILWFGASLKARSLIRRREPWIRMI
jgi:hypothetical protein